MAGGRHRMPWHEFYADLLQRLVRCERAIKWLEGRIAAHERSLRLVGRLEGMTNRSLELFGVLAFSAFVMAAIALFVALFK